jgi:hypothetical protein
MPDIQKIELERDNTVGVHEIKDRTRLEPAEPAPPGPDRAEAEKQRLEEQQRKHRDKEDFERATTPFPGG